MKRINAKTLLPFANGYILLSIFFYWFSTSMFLNPLAIAFFVIFGVHLFVAKGNAKIIFPIIFIIINLYMFLALFSEFSEFNGFTAESMTLLGVGTLYFGTNIASAVVMISNYFKPALIRL